MRSSRANCTSVPFSKQDILPSDPTVDFNLHSFTAKLYFNSFVRLVIMVHNISIYLVFFFFLVGSTAICGPLPP
jgi:hypothetical protein